MGRANVQETNNGSDWRKVDEKEDIGDGRLQRWIAKILWSVEEWTLKQRI